MSIPRNHHYVSQCQIKYFANESGEIFLYDKPLNNFYSRKGTKRIFSERDSNSIYKKGQIDRMTIEDDLKYFEDNYPEATKYVVEAAKKRNIDVEAQKKLITLGLFAITGIARVPEHKKNIDKTFEDLQNRIYHYLADNQKKEFDELMEYKKHVPHLNSMKYSDIAIRTYELMGGFDFNIYYLENKDVFILPDTSVVHFRGNLQETNNPHIRQVVEFGIPLTNKLFVHYSSKKLGWGSKLLTIEAEGNPTTYLINQELFNAAVKTIATSSENYLKNFVKFCQSN